MKKTRDKRGSVMVFLLLFFVTLTSAAGAFASAAKQRAAAAAAKELGLLWCGAILGEYDRNLAEKYSIFGFYGSEELTARKMNDYALKSFSGKRYLSFEGCRADLMSLSLTNPAVFRRQVTAAGKLAAAGKFAEAEKRKVLSAEEQPTAVDSDIPASTENSDREIRNAGVIASLPSKGVGGSFSLSSLREAVSGIHSLKDVVKRGGDQYWEDVYAFTFFRSALDEREKDQYFQNEIEYSICGKLSDSRNESGVKLRIVAVREVFNLAYILQDPEMSALTLEAAELLAPGAPAPAVQKLLQAAWALAESKNDYELLREGKKVPLFKDQDSWALSLDEIVVGGIPDAPSEGHRNEEGAESRSDLPQCRKELSYVVDPGNEEGDEYEDYLRLFLFLTDERVRLLRMMDLIQINMKYGYSEAFYLKDHYAGLTAEIEFHGRTVRIAKEYQPE